MSKSKFARLLCLVTLVAATIVLAIVPVQASGPSTSPRESLSQADLEGTPIVDAVTPKPDLAGKSVLFVDGDYYQQAPPDVIGFVGLAAKEGMPVVVLGTGLEVLCNSLSIGDEQVIYHDGQKGVSPVVAAAIRLYPDQTVDGVPFVSRINICGRQLSLESAIEVAQGFLADEAKRTFHKENASGAALLDGAWYWEYQCSQTYNDFGGYGNFNINRSYNRLMNDGSSTYDWRDVKYIMQTVPGKVKSGNGWKNDWTKMKALPEWQPVPPQPEWLLINYAPTTTSGETTVGVNVGVTAGSQGAAVTASMSWSYSVSDVVVYDSSDFQAKRFQLQHQIDESKAVGSYTYLHTPGASWRLKNNWLYFTPWEFYQAQYANKHWYGWTHWTSPQIEVKVWA